MYEAAWKENHENWINLETADIGCKADEPRYFPVCVVATCCSHEAANTTRRAPR